VLFLMLPQGMQNFFTEFVLTGWLLRPLLKSSNPLAQLIESADHLIHFDSD
jgi:hypothetical protein